MANLLQGRPAVFDLALRSDDPVRLYPGRIGLVAGDVTCQLKRAGAASWVTKRLDGASFREVGSGAYLLALDAVELDTTGTLLVSLLGDPGLAVPILPTLLVHEVVVPRDFSGVRPDLPQTVVVGQVAGLDGRPVARATISATLLQTPLLARGVAVAGDAVIAATDEEGFFEMPLVTGATVDVEVPAARYRRTLIVPPPPAPGVPVRLFAIP